MGYTDSQAALLILSGDGGSWRTRHLRMKASFARQLLQGGVWTLQHVAGEKMIADLGTKVLAGPRMTMLKEELGMTSAEGEEGAAEDRKKDEEKEEDTAEKIQKEEEIQKILRMVLVMAQIQAASAQRGEDEERWKTEFFVVMVLSVIGLITVMGWLWKIMGRRRSISLQREEEPGDQAEGKGGKGDTVRRRGARSYEARSPPRSSSQAIGSAHQTPESRTSSLADEFVDQVRRSMLGTPRSEPGQEPGTFREDFISGAVVFEGYTHPETWDPEVDGEIYPGKGEPPPWFFEEKGKKGGKKGEGKAKGKTRADMLCIGAQGGSRYDRCGLCVR